MSRPIGNRIREACAVLEEIGTSRYREVAERMNNCGGPYNARKYLQRASVRNLVTIDRSGEHALYTVNPEWRVLIDEPKAATYSHEALVQAWGARA